MQKKPLGEPQFRETIIEPFPCYGFLWGLICYSKWTNNIHRHEYNQDSYLEPSKTWQFYLWYQGIQKGVLVYNFPLLVYKISSFWGSKLLHKSCFMLNKNYFLRELNKNYRFTTVFLGSRAQLGLLEYFRHVGWYNFALLEYFRPVGIL